MTLNASIFLIWVNKYGNYQVQEKYFKNIKKSVFLSIT